MKENEVMIGDWFRFRYTIDGKEIVHTFRVSRIEDELGEYYVWGEGFGRMCYPKRLEPIPITPEILEKNGFAKEKEDELGITYYFLARPFTTQITLYKEPIGGVSILFKVWGRVPSFEGGVNDIHLCSVKYVHEMQHAIRLAGIEKEIII